MRHDKGRVAVPVAAIYGANASGNSNLLEPLAWLRDAVVQSFADWQPGSGVPRHHYELDPSFAQLPTRFAVDVVLGSVRHVYELAVDNRRVVEEKLTTYPAGRPRAVFRRTGESVTFGPTVTDAKTRGALLGRLTRENALFLSVAAINDVSEVGPLYQWFRRGLQVGAAELSEPVLAWHLDQKDGHILAELIRAADLGIKDIRVEGPPSAFDETVDREFRAIVQDIVDSPNATERMMELIATLGTEKLGGFRATTRQGSTSGGSPVAWLRLSGAASSSTPTAANTP